MQTRASSGWQAAFQWALGGMSARESFWLSGLNAINPAFREIGASSQDDEGELQGLDLDASYMGADNVYHHIVSYAKEQGLEDLSRD